MTHEFSQVNLVRCEETCAFAICWRTRQTESIWWCIFNYCRQFWRRAHLRRDNKLKTRSANNIRPMKFALAEYYW